MKKRVTLVVSILMIASMALSGCGVSSQTKDTSKDTKNLTENSNEENGDVVVALPGTWPIVDKKVTLDIFAPQFSYVKSLEYGENKFTTFYEDLTNVHVNWQLVPDSAMSEKKTVMLASGEYPDVFMGAWISKEEEMSYGQQGVFIPLNDLIDKYAVELKKALAEKPGFEEMITAPDGNVYSMPKLGEGYHVTYFNKLWYNKKWLENLNLDVPSTTEEFYEVLKAFKEQDPNNNGKADEIPLSGSVNDDVTLFFINSFIQETNDHFLLENGKVDINANKEAYREALKYLHKLYAEELIDSTVFTQDSNQLKQLGSNPEAALLGSFTAGLWWTAIDDQATNNRSHDYTALSPLKGPEGVQYARYSPAYPGTGQFVVTNKCKYPEVAVRFADYFYSEEGTLRSEVGVKGEEWDYISEEGVLDWHGEPARIKMTLDWAAPEWDWAWPQLPPSNFSREIRESQAAPDTPWESEYRLFMETKEKMDGYEPKEIFPPVYMSAEVLDEVVKLKTTINDYIKESRVRFITGNWDIEQDWDNYVEELNKIGLQRYLEIYQNSYDAQYK